MAVLCKVPDIGQQRTLGLCAPFGAKNKEWRGSNSEVVLGKSRESMDDPTFKLETVNKLLQQFFRDKQKTKCTGDALKLMAELLRIFIAEGVARAAQQAKVESSPTVETDHLEKILPQLLLDF